MIGFLKNLLRSNLNISLLITLVTNLSSPFKYLISLYYTHLIVDSKFQTGFFKGCLAILNSRQISQRSVMFMKRTTRLLVLFNLTEIMRQQTDETFQNRPPDLILIKHFIFQTTLRQCVSLSFHLIYKYLLPQLQNTQRV